MSGVVCAYECSAKLLPLLASRLRSDANSFKPCVELANRKIDSIWVG